MRSDEHENMEMTTSLTPGGGGVLPIIAYTGKLRPNGGKNDKKTSCFNNLFIRRAGECIRRYMKGVPFSNKR